MCFNNLCLSYLKNNYFVLSAPTKHEFSHEIQTLFFLQRQKKNLIFEGKLDE
jgi:hypothetical protein